MATNYTPPSGKTQAEQDIEAYADVTYEGNFVGDLTGNADTATLLKTPFTVTVTGDAAGSFSTAGLSTQMNLKVTHADQSNESLHAKTADTVTQADTALSAEYASHATHAQSSDKATNTVNAEYASTAGYASEAGTAATATEAVHAETATKATEATRASEALVADEAKVALALKNSESPVDYAKYADKAGLAVMAQYDCNGRSITDYYALKSDVVSKADAFTRQEADVLYLRRGDALKTATVTGKAFGTGIVNGTDLVIQITSLAEGVAGSFYDSVIFLTTAELPSQPDTTKIYITNDGVMWLYSQATSTWESLRGIISDSLSVALQEALEKLSNVVDLTTDQNVNGQKTFEDIPIVPIASLRDDPDRYVASLHNVRDARDRLKYLISEIKAELETKVDLVNARLDAQQRGDVLFAYVDYTVPANQVQMVVGTTYIGYLTEDGTFIEFDPATNEQRNPDLVPYYERHFYKTSDGVVRWRDFKMDSVTFAEYARLDGANFTGPVTVKSVDRPLETVGLEVLNIHDLRIIFNDLIDKAFEAADLDQYMPKTGGDFTGNITVPDQPILETATNNTVLNKGDIEKLIGTTAVTMKRLDHRPTDDSDLEAGVLYAIPVAP